MSWMILVAGVASAQDCEPTSAEQLSSTMQQALLDFATLDEESFYASIAKAEATLPCLDEVFLPPNAAAYHRMMGLKGFFDGDDDAATVAFRAALAIEPDYALSGKLAPEGGKLHRLWSGAQSGPNPFIGSFNAPAGKYAYVDGVETRTYAEDLPNIVQYGPGDGSILWTGYVDANVVPPQEIPAGGAVASSGSQTDPLAGLTTYDDVDDDPYAGLDDDDDDLDSLLDQDDKGDDFGRSSDSSYSRSSESTSSRERQDLVDAPKPEKKGGKGGLIAATVISGVAAGGLYGSGTYFGQQYARQQTRQNFYMTNGSYFGAIGCGVLTLTFGSLAIFTEDGAPVQPGIRF